jgi:hypothetical protein
LKSAATLTQETFKKVFSYQSGEDLLNRVDFDINRSQKADQQADKSSRSKGRPTEIREDQIKGPEQRNQDRSETQRQRVRVHCKRDCSDD